MFWDDGVYLIGAKSLATGAGYRFLHLPGAPPAVHFPPAWPAMLALVWKLSPSFPDNVVLLKLLNPLLLAAGAALACRYGVRRLDVPPPSPAATAVVFAAALPLMVIAGVLFPEPLFLVALILALALADRAVDRGGWRAAVEAGVAAGARRPRAQRRPRAPPRACASPCWSRGGGGSARAAAAAAPRAARRPGSSGLRGTRTSSRRRFAAATGRISTGYSACIASAARVRADRWRARTCSALMRSLGNLALPVRAARRPAAARHARARGDRRRR